MKTKILALLFLALFADSSFSQTLQSDKQKAKAATSSFGTIRNKTVDEDLQLCVNDGGSEVCGFKITGSTGASTFNRWPLLLDTDSTPTFNGTSIVNGTLPQFKLKNAGASNSTGICNVFETRSSGYSAVCGNATTTGKSALSFWVSDAANTPVQVGTVGPGGSWTIVPTGTETGPGLKIEGASSNSEALWVHKGTSANSQTLLRLSSNRGGTEVTKIIAQSDGGFFQNSDSASTNSAFDSSVPTASITSSTSLIRLSFTGSTNVSGGASNGNYIRFSDSDTTTTGSIQGNSATTIAFNTSSDGRLKHDIAQELKLVYPFAVTGKPDGDVNEAPMQVDYGKLTPVLAAAIKELKVQHDELKTQFDALKADYEAYKAAHP